MLKAIFHFSRTYKLNSSWFHRQVGLQAQIISAVLKTNGFITSTPFFSFLHFPFYAFPHRIMSPWNRTENNRNHKNKSRTFLWLIAEILAPNVFLVPIPSQPLTQVAAAGCAPASQSFAGGRWYQDSPSFWKCWSKWVTSLLRIVWARYRITPAGKTWSINTWNLGNFLSTDFNRLSIGPCCQSH